MNKLTEELKDDVTDFKATLALFSDDLFNRIPFEGSWTAGQVTEHIYKSIRGLPIVLNRNVAPAERDPEIHVKTLRDMFLNFNVKFESAESLWPSDDHHDIDDFSKKIVPVLNKLVEISHTEDLTLLCTGFEFPTIGQLTRLEMLNFSSVHLQRHIRQMKNIRKHL